MIYNFDIKSYLSGGRKILESPRDILNLDIAKNSQSKYKEMTLKDQDFLQSFKKLDITQAQSEKIIS